METRNYQINNQTPHYFGDIENIKKEIKECQKCQSNLIFQHVPNYDKLIVKEIIRCACCKSQSIHQLHQLH